MATKANVAKLIQIISHEFGNTIPLDATDATATRDAIANSGAMSDDNFAVATGIEISEFMQINVQHQWAQTNGHLWRTIQLTFDKNDLTPPDDWAADNTMDTLAEHLS